MSVNTVDDRLAGTVNGPTEDFMGNTRLGFTIETKIDRTDSL